MQLYLFQEDFSLVNWARRQNGTRILVKGEQWVLGIVLMGGIMLLIWIEIWKI